MHHTRFIQAVCGYSSSLLPTLTHSCTVPEIKAILGGYILDPFLSPQTLCIKALGLALSVSSGLSLGKEGPLVHVACCMASVLASFFKQFRNDQGLVDFSQTLGKR